MVVVHSVVVVALIRELLVDGIGIITTTSSVIMVDPFGPLGMCWIVLRCCVAALSSGRIELC